MSGLIVKRGQEVVFPSYMELLLGQQSHSFVDRLYRDKELVQVWYGFKGGLHSWDSPQTPRGKVKKY